MYHYDHDIAQAAYAAYWEAQGVRPGAFDHLLPEIQEAWGKVSEVVMELVVRQIV